MQRLLVVDDEPNIQFTIAETLGSDELEVIAAGTPSFSMSGSPTSPGSKRSSRFALLIRGFRS